MVVGGSTTAAPWIQAPESKYWNMCLFLYMCHRAQCWAHFEGGNPNSHCDPASPILRPYLSLTWRRAMIILMTHLPSHLSSGSTQPKPYCTPPPLPTPTPRPSFSHSCSPSCTSSFEGDHSGSPWFCTRDLFQGHACISGSFSPSIWWATSLYISVEASNG